VHAFSSTLKLNLYWANDYSFIDELTQNNVTIASNVVGGMHTVCCLLFSSNTVLHCDDIIAIAVKPMVSAVANGPVLFLRTIY
jgi:hypothetical protein